MNGIGGVWLYRKNQNKFIFDSELIGSNNVGSSFQGISISINYDGSIIAVGGSGDNYGVGACWIFEKYEKFWKQFKLVGSNNIGYYHQGNSIDVSHNGSYLIFGGCDDGEYNGACWIYKKCDSTWKELLKISGNNLFGKFVHIGYDNISFIIGSNDKVFVYSNINDNFILTSIITHEQYLHNHINLFVSHKNILISSGNVVNIYKKCKNSENFIIKYIIKDDHIKQILSLCSCGNSNTILIHGVSYDDEYILWCFICVNGKYQKISTQHLSHLLSANNKYFKRLLLSMSYDGSHTLIGCNAMNDFNGCCFVLG